MCHDKNKKGKEWKKLKKENLIIKNHGNKNRIFRAFGLIFSVVGPALPRGKMIHHFSRQFSYDKFPKIAIKYG
jgi:hypothetical protein